MMHVAEYTGYRTLRFERRERVLRVIIDRAGVLNAINEEMHDDLSRVLRDLVRGRTCVSNEDQMRITLKEPWLNAYSHVFGTEKARSRSFYQIPRQAATCQRRRHEPLARERRATGA